MSTPLVRLREAMKAASLDALWVSLPENVRYISGFTSPEDAKVLVTHEAATLYTDARYTVQAAEESTLPQYIERPPATLEHAATLLGGLTVGIEAEHLSVANYETLQKVWHESKLVTTRNLIEPLRLVKSADEIAAIRAAQEIADAAFAEILPFVQPGISEVALAGKLEQAMRARGAQGPAFETIVASGVRGALPHGRATDKLLESGDLVTFDFGALKDGYHSDMTRTVAVGPQSEENVHLYRAVLEAEEAAIAAVKPGVRAADLDKLSRDILAKHGLDQYFTHSLGHGVGLNIHEGPGLSKISEAVLEAGMVITIEPGVYLPGKTGLRIEDLLLVTETGYEVLSQSPKEQL